MNSFSRSYCSYSKRIEFTKPFKKSDYEHIIHHLFTGCEFYYDFLGFHRHTPVNNSSHQSAKNFVRIHQAISSNFKSQISLKPPGTNENGNCLGSSQFPSTGPCHQLQSHMSKLKTPTKEEFSLSVTQTGTNPSDRLLLL